MIYKFNLISDEVSNFKLEIQIDADATFLSLRNAILDAVGYTKDQMDSFILCDEDIWLMDETPISDLIEDEGQRMMFVFDYLTNRAFFMEMKELIPSKHLADPLCSRKVGMPPKQNIDLDEFDSKIAKAAATTSIDDLDADFYGAEGFNEDELDLEGYDDLDLQ